MSAYRALMSPFKIKNLELKNRLMSAAHASSYAENGQPGKRYQAYHEEKARGGIGLTMFGGSSNISRDSGSIYGQIYVGNDDVIPYFQEFADRIHAYDCALMCQITHMGRRNSWQSGDWLSTVGPSLVRDPAHHAMPREAELEDIQRITKCFGDAALRCRDGGLDGCEVLASVHILGQFLSPLSNLRNDEYGGDLGNRCRFLIEVLTEVRSRVGDEFIVGLRYTADESNEGGIDADDGVAIAELIGNTGLIDIINVNGAYGGTAKGMSEAFPGMGNPSAPFLELARRVKTASGLPTVQASRITDVATANHAIEDGCLDLVGMVRPHISDPHIIAKLESGNEPRIRPCVGAGLCLDRVYLGGDMICIHNASTGREDKFPHEIPKADVKKKVVVIGGGPAGLEAARVSRLRGHDVVLFEATDRLGGQIVFAAKAGWRKDMIGIADWLASEVELVGVDIRYNNYAEADDILCERPNVVIVATGGIPDISLPAGGGDLAHSSWDMLSGQVQPGGNILIYDEVSGHAAMSLADWLSSSGFDVELITPDRQSGRELGGLNYPKYLEHLYTAGVRLTPDHKLIEIRRNGNELIAVLANMYSRRTHERKASQIVIDQGTVPNSELYTALKDRSVNRGMTDPDAFADGLPQPHTTEKHDQFALYRIGDAVSSRDIHAAIFDGNRIGRTV